MCDSGVSGGRWAVSSNTNPTIGDDVYVVWNSGYTTDAESRYRFPSRSSLTRQLNGALVVKAVHRFAP